MHWTQARDARGLLLPLGEALAPGVGGLGGEFLDRQAFACGVRRIDPRLEVCGTQFREGEHQVAEVAFGIDADRRDTIDRGLFEQRQAKTGFAAAGHPYADGVRGQVFGVVEDQVVLDRERLEGLVAGLRLRVIAGYWAMKDEPDLAALMARWHTAMGVVCDTFTRRYPAA